MSHTSIENCPFCNTNVLDAEFAESENFRAIYNRAPILAGHSLVIPKRHVKGLMDLSELELCELVIFGRKAVKILLRAFSARAFDWSIQDGEEAGQTVPHLHLHLIPRKSDDLPRPGDWYSQLRKSHSQVIDSGSRVKLTPDQMKETVTYIRKVAKGMITDSHHRCSPSG
jgi:bis(5'-adenosyl)-triphosphatase